MEGACFLPPRTPGLARFAVVQHLEANELVDVAGSQRGLVEVDPELLHPDRSHVDHASLSLDGRFPAYGRGELYRPTAPNLNSFLTGFCDVR